MFTSIIPESKSVSSPSCFAWISLENLFFINFHKASLTNVLDLVAVRSQEPTLTLHSGQLRLLCCIVPFKHLRHKLWAQGNVTGSIRIPLHTGHIKSAIFNSADVREGKLNNFDVGFKYVAIFSSQGSLSLLN